MYDIALSVATHDLIIKDGDLILIDNAERVSQQIKIKLRSFLGEWFLDTTYGVPYLEEILIKNPSLNNIRNILRTQILDVDDVAAVTSLELSLNSSARTLTVTFECQTTYGLVTSREVLGYGN
jgi:hypothetical protein